MPWRGAGFLLLVGCSSGGGAADGPWAHPDPNPSTDDGAGDLSTTGGVAIRRPAGIEVLGLSAADGPPELLDLGVLVPCPDGEPTCTVRAVAGQWDRMRTGLALDLYLSTPDGAASATFAQFLTGDLGEEVETHAMPGGSRPWHGARHPGGIAVSFRGSAQLALFGESTEPLFLTFGAWADPDGDPDLSRTGFVNQEILLALQRLDPSGEPAGPGAIVAVSLDGAIRQVAEGLRPELWAPSWPSDQALVAVDEPDGRVLRRLDEGAPDGLGDLVTPLDLDGTLLAILPDDAGRAYLVVSEPGRHRLLCATGGGQPLAVIEEGEGEVTAAHLSLPAMLTLALDDGEVGRLRALSVAGCGEPTLQWELPLDGVPVGVALAGLLPVDRP